MTYSNHPFQVISDGKYLYVITNDNAIKVTDPLLTEYHIQLSCPVIDVTTPYSEFKEFVPGLREPARISFDLIAPKIDIIKDSKDIILDFFQDASIRDLLVEINKKIEQRG